MRATFILAGLVIGLTAGGLALLAAVKGANRMVRVEMAVLYALEDGHCTGFDIAKTAGLGLVQTYKALIRLKNDGLVASRWVESWSPTGVLIRQQEWRITERGRVG